MDAVVEATGAGTVTVIGGLDMTTRGNNRYSETALEVSSNLRIQDLIQRRRYRLILHQQKVPACFVLVRNGGGDTATACKKYGTEDKAFDPKRAATVDNAQCFRSMDPGQSGKKLVLHLDLQVSVSFASEILHSLI